MFTEEKEIYIDVISSEDCHKLQVHLDRLSDDHNINRIKVNVRLFPFPAVVVVA